MKKHFFYILTAVTSAILVSLFSANIRNYASAGALTIPNSFSAGQKIVATSMNQNFQAIASWSSVIASDNIIDGGISSSDIATSAIVTAKIADQAVITAKLADGAVTPAKLSASSYYWAGYHATNCAWTATSASGYANFTPDTSCTFTTRQAGNIGTVTSYFMPDRSTGQEEPGITFTPPRTGPFLICATFGGSHTTTGSAYSYKMMNTNASTSIVETSMVSTNGGKGQSVNLCGIYVSDTSIATRSIVITGGSNANSFVEINGSGTFGAINQAVGIDWFIWGL